MKISCFTNSAFPTPALYRWVLASVMLSVIGFGWKYPMLGFVVPAAMLTGMLGGAMRGRYVCGNLCPRGSFFDSFFASFAPRRPIPERLFGMKLRWALMAGLMGFMSYRLAQNPGSLAHWGLVFWQMCLVTTGAAVVLGLLYRPRTWCIICPVGTMANATGGGKRLLAIAESCRSCNLCEKNCPVGYRIGDFKVEGAMRNPDCLQCATCVHVCPVAALSIQKPTAFGPRVDGGDKPEDAQRAA